ncbi:MAG: hypothetical protein ABJP45_09320 [Cyclobacteriaceae bacterium]
MQKNIVLLLMLCTTFLGVSQSKKFRSSDQKMLVVKGDIIEVNADSAYIISSSRALILNEKLDELTSARKLNGELKSVNDQLLTKVKEVEKLVSKILSRMESDKTDIGEGFDDILAELDKSLDVMKENNKDLAANNSNLKLQITAMDDTINKLKKEIRGIWWNGVADKIVVGILGLGIGLLIGL